MRRCGIPTGCKRADKPCCADCGDKTCQARCWNDPKRCRCWTEAPPPRAEKARRRGAPRKLDPLRVAYLYSQGVSMAEIARRLGCHWNSVARILRELEGKRHDNS